MSRRTPAAARTSTAARAYTDWQRQQPHRTAQDHARQAAIDAPSAAVIARVTDAYLGQDVTLLRQGEFRGWRWRLYRSHIVPNGAREPDPGRVYVCAERMGANGVPECLTQDCAGEDAARDWMGAAL